MGSAMGLPRPYGSLSGCNLQRSAAQMCKGRLARIAVKGQGHVKPTKSCSFGDRTDGRAYGAEPVPSGVFNNRLEPHGSQGHGFRRLWSFSCRAMRPRRSLRQIL